MGIFSFNSKRVNKKDHLGKRQSLIWSITLAGYRRQVGDLVQMGIVRSQVGALSSLPAEGSGHGPGTSRPAASSWRCRRIFQRWPECSAPRSHGSRPHRSWTFAGCLLQRKCSRSRYFRPGSSESPSALLHTDGSAKVSTSHARLCSRLYRSI